MAAAVKFGQVPSSTNVSMTTKFAIFGVTIAAMYSLYVHLRLRISTSSPSLADQSEMDCGGRLAEREIANVLKKFSGMHVYQALHVPESGHQGRKEVDLVLLTKRKVYVVQVKNWSGVVKLEIDGTWCYTSKAGLVQKLPNVVEDTEYCAKLLESYIARRGVTLPSTSLQYKIVFVNPECRVEQAILSQPEVLSFDQWESFLAKEAKKGLLSWMKAMLHTKSKVALANSIYKQLRFILSTAPTWDRLELVGGRTILGDFMYFTGRPGDVEALRIVKRSSVSHLTISHQQQWMLSLLGMFVGIFPEILISCTLRDYRIEATSQSSNHHTKPVNMEHAKSTFEARVRPDLEVVFQSAGSTRPQHFKLTSVTLLSLSA